MKFGSCKYIFLSLIILLTGGLLGSCVDEIIPDTNGGDEESPLPQDGYSLNFKVNLEVMTREGTTSDFEKMEDYIDPDNLHILFFYDKTNGIVGSEEKYNTLIKKFDSSEVSLIPVNGTGDNYSKQWYISIPIKENNEEFGNIIRNNNFKIAVLANWPSTVDLNEPDGTTLGDNVHKLHHQPTPSGQGDDPYLSNPTYDFLKEDQSKMGAYINWVNSGYSVEEAKDFIINNYGPGVNLEEYTNPVDKYGQRKYDELWQRWNFSDAYFYLPQAPEDETKKDSRKTYREDVAGYNYTPKMTQGYDPFFEKWAAKNYNDLYNLFWKEKDVEVKNEKGEIETVKKFEKISNGSNLENFGNLNKGYFQFKQNSNESGPKSYIHTSEGNTAGLVLRAGGNKDNNVIIIKIPNNGELNINWGSLGGSSTLKMETRNHLDDSTAKDKTIQDASNSDKYNFDTTYSSSKDFKSNEIKITGDAEYLFIYAEGADAIIYNIEYISSYYLHNIDNIGKPYNYNKNTREKYQESNFCIPMYGIQSFARLGNLWQPGTVFDLSDFNKLGDAYNQSITPKSIPLIRSVAKVELKIPKTYKAHHVFLRSINRRGRCEPMDVSTPTGLIWDKTPVSTPVNGHGDECHDWGKIYGHTPFYNPSASSDKTQQYNNYRSKLAWYFGNWSKDNKIGDVSINSDDQKTNITDYPQIMNVIIQRTDFTEFIEAGSDSYYDRYVLYVPEKYVDDPGSTGPNNSMETSSPKICHIEFRQDTDPFTNVDDNWCYRIYFTENGFYSNEGRNSYPSFGKLPEKDSNGEDKIDSSGNPITYEDNWENSYEKNVDNLQHHWPIIRNHYYRFTVVDAKNRIVVTKIEVLPWRMIDDNRYNW